MKKEKTLLTAAIGLAVAGTAALIVANKDKITGAATSIKNKFSRKTDDEFEDDGEDYSSSASAEEEFGETEE